MNILDDKISKVFISYSWSSQEKVIELAERLVSHGIDVVMDIWNLKEGQDKYAFMEQCVNNSEIDKVLIICDQKYTEKANNREGGVGDETVIISSEVYGKVKQEKFIPIIFEKDEEKNPYCPAYIKSRIYIDLSSEGEYETEYEKLLRNIYEQPLFKKPALGRKPEWLENSNINYFPLEDIIKQIKGCNSTNKAMALIKRFEDSYIQSLKDCRIQENEITPQMIYDKIVEMKTIRDIYLDFLDNLLMIDVNLSEIISSLLEKVYNSILDVNIFGEEISISFNLEKRFEYYKFYIWETFICSVAFLKYYEKYKELHNILCTTYFLRANYFKNGYVKETSYITFYSYCSTLEEQYKLNTQPELRDLTAKMLCEREKKPIYTKSSLAEADLLLYQLYNIYELKAAGGTNYWCPRTHIYFEERYSQWNKLKSRKYCEKVMPLFGVSSLEELKNVIKKCIYDKNIRYNSGYKTGYDAAPTILSSIKLEEIGILN